jgi:hypothetical protein
MGINSGFKGLIYHATNNQCSFVPDRLASYSNYLVGEWTLAVMDSVVKIKCSPGLKDKNISAVSEWKTSRFSVTRLRSPKNF